MTNKTPQPLSEEQLRDKIEHELIMELQSWSALRTQLFIDFHGQEVGEDPELDKLDKRVRKAYKTILKKVEQLILQERQAWGEYVIGEDETHWTDHFGHESNVPTDGMNARNGLRAEQRKRNTQKELKDE